MVLSGKLEVVGKIPSNRAAGIVLNAVLPDEVRAAEEALLRGLKATARAPGVEGGVESSRGNSRWDKFLQTSDVANEIASKMSQV